MGGFWKEEEHFEYPVPTLQSTHGAEWLDNFMNSWGTTQIPKLEVANLTPFQQQMMSNLPGFSDTTTQNYDASKNQYLDTLNNEYDPRNSDYYKGLRQEADRLKRESNTDIRQRANLGGMANSSSAMGVEAANNRNIDNNTLMQLGSMYENERSNKLNAAGQLSNLDSNRLSQEQQLLQLADVERQQQQQEFNAVFEQVMKQTMLPYEQQAQIALSMMQTNRPYQLTGGDTTEAAQWLGFGLAGAALGGI